MLKVWSKRHRDLGRARTQVAPCRLHAVLCELIPGGIAKEIVAAQAAHVLEEIEPSVFKRRISEAIYSRLQADARRAAAFARTRGPGGQPGNDSVASAAGSHPENQLFGQATPEPATTLRRLNGHSRTRPAPAAKKTRKGSCTVHCLDNRLRVSTGVRPYPVALVSAAGVNEPGRAFDSSPPAWLSFPPWAFVRSESGRSAIRLPRCTNSLRTGASLDTALACPQGTHLLVGRQHRSAQDRAIAPLEVATVRVVPHPRRPTSQGAIEVHRIHHISDVGMLHRGAHATTVQR